SGRGRSRTVPAGWFRRDRQSSGTSDVLSGSCEARHPASPADAAKQWQRVHLIWTLLARHAIGCPPKWGQTSTSVPIPKFASPCGTLGCELRNQRDTSKSFDSSVVFGFEVPMRSFLQTRRNFKSTTLGCLQCRP